MKTVLFSLVICCLSGTNKLVAAPAQELPNILWISTEDISPAWGCYGDKEATTPHIDAIAKQGYLFKKAFSNAPICAPARSTLISGMYATSLGTQNLRSDIPIPKSLKTLPELMRERGYFTSNNVKTDYNFSPDGRWDDLGNKAHWRNRTDKKPFFSVFNFMITHEGPTNNYKPEDTQSIIDKHKPDRMNVPPYFPNTPEFRKIMAHQYDLISVFDQGVGKILDELKADGLYDNTIVFIFSDHGSGLPRHKRWLNNTGLRIPFVLHVPEKYRELVANLPAKEVDLNVSFVDFAPTVLKLAGAAIPPIMEGKPFLGKDTKPNPYSYGYRDRADDVYDMSRSVFDGRYFYVRHYMPHLPYIQKADIFSDRKWAYRELLRVKDEGKLSAESMKMFLPKGNEELYDLQTDPHELTNLIDQKEQQANMARLHEKLKQHLLNTHDTGLMNEGRMMVLSKNTSVYEMARNRSTFDVKKALDAAEQVGHMTKAETLNSLLENDDPNVRFWGLIAAQDTKLVISSLKNRLRTMLNDSSAPNRYSAAEILINRLDDKEPALAMFEREITEQQDEPLMLQLVISIRNIGEQAKPLIPIIKEKMYPKIAGSIMGKYKNWSYPMFIGFALDQAYLNCGEAP